jgi:tripartite-type tricarboxylate transporter receptor subunit TctC
MTMPLARRRWIRTGLALATLPLGGTALAQSAWPQRPLRMIIGFAPGGPTDIVARVIAARLAEQLGVGVVVDNKPGAGGNLAADLAAKAAPDGHTLFYNTSAITIAPALYGKVPYDTLKDFVPVTTTATNAMIVMVHPSVPAKTAAEFVAHARSQAGKLNYASSGTGTITHLATAALASSLGLQMTHVPYKGSAPALVDTAAGVVQLMTDTVNSALPYVKDGRLRALAVTMPRRLSVLPDVPTLAETVLPGMEMSAWQGVVLPAGTPAPIVQRLNEELRKVLAHEETRQKLIAQGTEILGSTPQDYAAYLRSELARWSKVVAETGAKAE